MSIRTALFSTLALTALASTASAAEVARYRVTIEGDDGRYLIADNDAAYSMSADSTDPTGSREHFTLIEHENGSFNLQAYHDRFVVVERDYTAGFQPVMADNLRARSWERLYPEGGQVAFETPGFITTHHGTILRQRGDDLQAEVMWGASAENDFIVRKEGFAARFLNPNGHSPRSDGSVDYVGDVEVPASDGQAMILSNAQVNYRRDDSGAFTRFSGRSDDLVLDLDGLAAELGDLPAEDTTFDLLNPGANWPGSVPRGERYLRLYNTNASSWGPIGIRPTAWGKRAMLFDHHDGTVHLKGYVDVTGDEVVSWLSVGPAAACDLEMTAASLVVGDYAIDAAADLCIDLDRDALDGAPGAAVVTALDLQGDATIDFANADGAPVSLPMTDGVAVIDAQAGTADFAGDVNGQVVLPWAIAVDVIDGTVSGAVGAAGSELVVSVSDVALGRNTAAMTWRFDGDLVLSQASNRVRVLGSLTWGTAQLRDIDWDSNRYTEPTAANHMENQTVNEWEGRGTRLSVVNMCSTYNGGSFTRRNGSAKVTARWAPGQGSLAIVQSPRSSPKCQGYNRDGQVRYDGSQGEPNWVLRSGGISYDIRH